MKNPQGKSVGAPAERRATSAVAAQINSGDDTDLGDAYLNADNGWPATGNEAAALQSEYDALADLFLSEEVATPAPSPASPTAPAAPTPHTQGASTPSGQITSKSPALRTPSARQVIAGPARAAAPAAPVLTRQLPTQGIDCLILGHLPVLAGAWSLQYARATAERTGMPVALVRSSGGSVSIEVIFASPEQAVTLRAGGPTANFENALDRARAVAPRLMLRVDETSELDVLGTANTIDRIAVLCGADDMAVVATYRTIKHLIGNPALRFEGGNDADGHATAMGVAIMGAESAAAEDAISRLNRATQTFLGRPISYLACIPKMGPCSTSSLFRGEWTRSTPALVEEIVELWGTPAPQRSELALPELIPVSREAECEPARGTPQVHVRRGVEPARLAAQGVAPAAPAAETPGAAMITGLRPLATRSPYTQGVELASDSAGSLHLVAMLAGADATAAFASEAVGRLLAVASWASDHAALLSLAHPQLDENAIGSGPALHLITDDPRAARGVLSTGVRVHMATSVTIHGRANWVCNALN